MLVARECVAEHQGGGDDSEEEYHFCVTNRHLIRARVLELADSIVASDEALANARARLIVVVLALCEGVQKVGGGVQGMTKVVHNLEVVARQGLSDSSKETYYKDKELPFEVDAPLAASVGRVFGNAFLRTFCGSPV